METEIFQIKRTIYSKPASRWGIWQTDKGTIKGIVEFDVADGDRVKLAGKWETSKFNGKREFSFAFAYPDLPEDVRTLLHYACSITVGIGDRAEEKIWEAYGADWRDDSTLERISGLTWTARFNWGETLKRLDNHASQARTIAWLMERGATLNMANAAWSMWQSGTSKKVQADPYILAEVPHYGFQDVDAGIRQKFGIDDSDPRRMRAAILYAVEQVRGEGNTVAAIDDIRERIEKLCPVQILRFDEVVESMLREGTLSMVEDHKNFQVCVCLTKDMDAEKEIGVFFDAVG